MYVAKKKFEEAPLNLKKSMGGNSRNGLNGKRSGREEETDAEKRELFESSLETCERFGEMLKEKWEEVQKVQKRGNVRWEDPCAGAGGGKWGHGVLLDKVIEQVEEVMPVEDAIPRAPPCVQVNAYDLQPNDGTHIEQRDFLSTQEATKHNVGGSEISEISDVCVVMNPPFTKAEAFLKRVMEKLLPAVMFTILPMRCVDYGTAECQKGDPTCKGVGLRYEAVLSKVMNVDFRTPDRSKVKKISCVMQCWIRRDTPRVVKVPPPPVCFKYLPYKQLDEITTEEAMISFLMVRQGGRAGDTLLLGGVRSMLGIPSDAREEKTIKDSIANFCLWNPLHHEKYIDEIYQAYEACEIRKIMMSGCEIMGGERHTHWACEESGRLRQRLGLCSAPRSDRTTWRMCLTQECLRELLGRVTNKDDQDNKESRVGASPPPRAAAEKDRATGANEKEGNGECGDALVIRAFMVAVAIKINLLETKNYRSLNSPVALKQSNVSPQVDAILRHQLCEISQCETPRHRLDVLIRSISLNLWKAHIQIDNGADLRLRKPTQHDPNGAAAQVKSLWRPCTCP